jgi:hypothetical protein
MALEATDDILALANALADVADALQARLMDDIQAGRVDQAQTADLFRRVSALREAGDALCADAAGQVVAGLALPQADLLGAIRTARAEIQATQDFGRLLGLAGNLVRLGTAAVAGQPGPILAALKGVRAGLQAGAEGGQG